MLVKFNFKCYANTFVKVDVQIEEDCRQTIYYLKGHSYLKFYCKKQSNQKLRVNTVSTLRRTILSWVRGDIKELLFIKLTLYLSLSFRNKCWQSKIKLLRKPAKRFERRRFPFWRKNKATNSHPLFNCNENLEFVNLFTLLKDFPSYSHGKFDVGDNEKNKTIVILVLIFIPSKW